MATAAHYKAWALGCGQELRDAHQVLEIPRSVAECPKCDGAIYVEFEEWEQRKDGSWGTTRAIPECENQPGIDTREWRPWFNWHYDMPYVDWMPLEVRLTRWVNQRYSFDLD